MHQRPMYTSKSLYDVVDILTSEGIDTSVDKKSRWIPHISETIACQRFYKALNDKYPIHLALVEVIPMYENVVSICLVLDSTAKFPGFGSIYKDCSEVAFCYDATTDQLAKVLPKLS